MSGKMRKKPVNKKLNIMEKNSKELKKKLSKQLKISQNIEKIGTFF